MADHRTLVDRLFWITLLFVTFDILVVDLVAASTDYPNYHQLGLESSEVCHPLGKTQTIYLGSLKENALIIKQSHKFESRRTEMKCKFKVQAPFERGLFAVIQKMSLRSHVVNGTVECLDYIRFLSENGGSSDRYCGKLETIDGTRRLAESSLDDEYDEDDSKEDSSEEEQIVKGFDELSRKGKITTEVFVSKQPLKRGEKLDLIIAFTPFIDCESFKNGVFGATSVNGPRKCIESKLHCDNVINCASSHCSDEYDCTNKRNGEIKKLLREDQEAKAKVTYAAVTGLLICVIILTLCLWTCRKYKKLCWSSDCAGPSVVNDSAVQLPMQRRDHSVSHPLPVSSAPMLEVAVSNSPDKDLPPSYDSLFPPAANTTDNA
ncbi:uncharacterized protein LOC106655200 [Trichogramma pretiosum]|uniref:uncharacterized protein LOC106655200 n=1 Tax=Trichogramma pretiosum TaxID=7493 RepID=UPI0006C9DA3F|nr:uncharacterized protein LOC106655200 [Trichogramma pretiosum]XP_014230956.1 uncharacterized protein LOC106655200 [Trichogramma pretiosum]XP_014230965.1 uncharacterized protein LOC106655200 [Trichogramma pretiosum]XP_014230974.1 uncharacterized protein LOC106655200 [Trichogramma pretiosum]